MVIAPLNEKGKKFCANSNCSWRVRISERNNSADTSISEGGRRDALGTRAEIALQPMVKTMVRQAVPLQPLKGPMMEQLNAQSRL